MSENETRETIFIVIGETGEYSDRNEWMVCAYRDENMARVHAENATIEANRIEATTPRFGHEPDEQAKLWDGNMRMDYTGTTYTVLPVTIRDSLPAQPTLPPPNPS